MSKKIMNIYEDSEKKLIFINKESIGNYISRMIGEDWGKHNVNTWIAEGEEFLKRLIKENKGKRIFWKLRYGYDHRDGSFTWHTNWSLNREEAKEYLLKAINRDFWFNVFFIDKYRLIGAKILKKILKQIEDVD